MRGLISLVWGVLFALLACVPAIADYDQSKGWFERLTADERTETQASLILLGHYEYLVDGQFGSGTYQALTAFQQGEGGAATGALTETERSRLLELAAEVYARLGMDVVRDTEGQVALIMPVGLLTEKAPRARGNTYASSDGGLVLETARHLSSEIAFRTLYDDLKTPGQGRYIVYSSYSSERFVVSGKQDGRSFHSHFRKAPEGAVGYTITWTSAYEDPARMLSVFIASHFSPIGNLPGEEPTKMAASPGTAGRYGVFELPAEPADVIVLNGEVTLSLASDFQRALEARPEARYLVLNSPGGYVDNALAVAHEVRRRRMATLVAPDMGCYSACAYIFFAGESRQAVGELGVHQISAEVADLVLAQTTLSDVLDALDQFQVEQVVITRMLRTPPDDMYVFSPHEISQLGINRGEIQLALLPDLQLLGNDPNLDDGRLSPPAQQPVTPASSPGSEVAYVQLALQSTEKEAQRSLAYARERWAGILGSSAPEIERAELPQGTVFLVRVAIRSVENANAICSAIKAAGGGCYVTTTE